MNYVKSMGLSTSRYSDREIWIKAGPVEHVWVLEDYIVPPLGAAEWLLRGFAQDVASVAGVYYNRFHPDQILASDRKGKHFTTATALGASLEDVGGNGFGCAILRRSILQEVAIRHDGPPSSWYDVNFYHDVAASGRY